MSLLLLLLLAAGVFLALDSCGGEDEADTAGLNGPANGHGSGTEPAEPSPPLVEGMVYVAAGPFPHGQKTDENETGEPLVTLKAYYIDKMEVTNRQYGEFLEALYRTGDHALCHPGEPPQKDHAPSFRDDPFHGKPDCPVVGVDWFDAYAYAAWRGRRLPTEAEWEKAARGSQGFLYPWGDEWLEPPPANLQSGPIARLQPVLYYEDGRSPYGCFQLLGNAAEWCADWYAPGAFENGPLLDPTGPPTGDERLVRGGGCQTPPEGLTTLSRFHEVPTRRREDLGFRCAMDVEPTNGR